MGRFVNAKMEHGKDAILLAVILAQESRFKKVFTEKLKQKSAKS